MIKRISCKSEVILISSLYKKTQPTIIYKGYAARNWKFFFEAMVDFDFFQDLKWFEFNKSCSVRTTIKIRSDILTKSQKSRHYAIASENRPTATAAAAYRIKYTIVGDTGVPESTQRLNFYTNRIVGPWNALNKRIIESDNLDIFKNQIDKNSLLNNSTF